jgi:MoaA/NifB/PqqE/SkfB family radical SAM enzyme
VAHETRLGLCAGDPLDYRFCRPTWRTSQTPVPLATLLEQVQAINKAECRRLIFSDAPLAHPDFDALVRACQEHGLRHFALETDGRPLSRPGVVESLVEQGFEKIFVVVGGIRKRVYEAVMADDGFVEAIEGVRRVALSPLELYVVAPMLRWTEEDLEPLLDYLLSMGGRLAGFLPAVPEVSRVPSAFRRGLLPHGAQAKLAARLFDACARNKVEYGFFGKRGLLPCASGGALDRFGTVFFERMSHLKHSANAQAERFDRVVACESCSLTQSCAGVDAAYLATFGAEGLSAVPLDTSMDWKLKRINRLDERGVKSVSAFENEVENQGRSLVRINGHCNMSCAFCFIDRTVPDFETEGLKRSIDELATQNLDHLVLSGGEPTLHPDLDALVAHARKLNFRTIEIQSNGVKAAEMAYARRLADAGLNKITVSLHSVDPEHSDKITRLPKAFGKTMAALHNFRALGVLTQVAHVITKSNFRELPETVRFLRNEFPAESGHLSICFGIAQPISDLVYTWVMPQFDEVKPFMKQALDYCLETDIGFGGMIGQGGYPPCMLDGDLRYYEKNLIHIYKSADHDEQFHKPERCRECSFDPWCLGVRKYYVDTYGDAEVKPFKADVPAPSALPPAPPAPSPANQPRERLIQLGRRSQPH